MISLVKKYLDINRYSKSKETFKDLYQSHPNYPSLFAITDSLDALAIENVAAKIPKEQFFELPTHFLANYKEEIVFVDKTNQLIKIEKDNGAKLSIDTNDFLTNWNGIIVVIEPNEKPISQEKKTLFKNDFSLIFAACLVLVISSVFYFGFNFSTLFYLTTSIIGLIVSVLVVQEKFGIHSETVSKICNGFNASCDSVIKSEKGKINKWISFSDLPLIFFTTNFFSILLHPFQAIQIIGMVSLFSIPVLLYSIWMQKIVLKKWCPICLIVSVIIVFQAIVFFYLYDKQLVDVTKISFFYYGFLLIVVLLFWSTLNPLIENKLKSKSEIITLLRLKRNFEVFNSLSNKIKDEAAFNELSGILIGNSKANLKITLFLSPSCGHCHTAFQEGYSLVNKFPEKVCIQILFNINLENPNNQYLKVVQNLLSINEEKNHQVLEAISDWHIKKMTLKDWLQKWNVNTINERIENQILKQYNWCLENKFNYTPVKIVNTKLLPETYEMKELIYFLNDFETKNPEETLLIQEPIE